MSNQRQPKTNLSKNPPIGPDQLSDAKLNLILKNEFADWKIVHSQLPPKPLS